MTTDKKVITVTGLELHLRPADKKDLVFCYELMSHNMKAFFDNNTQEKWSRAKFMSGFKPDRITVIEHERMPIGFYDHEMVGDELYFHNVQLSEDYQKYGIGTQIFNLVEQKARNYGARAMIGKVFAENSKMIEWVQKFGYKLHERIEHENSYWVRKDIE